MKSIRSMSSKFAMIIVVATAAVIQTFVSSVAFAQEADPEMLKLKEFFEVAGSPMGKWIEGETFFPAVAPASHFKASMLYYPGTEVLQEDEVRVTFMGSTYYPSQSQSGMSIFVELGNGDNFVFDMGIGSLRNYNSFSIPFNSIDKIFFSHLHMDHMSDLPYFTMFRPIQFGYTPIQIYGPSGSEPKYGIKYMMDRMMEMTAWHQDSFHGWPIGEGFDLDVHEFDFMDEGGIAYEQNGVKITHWPTSHTKDGATSYRLDWNGRSVCYTGDNRPNSLTIKYCQGVDMLISEAQNAAVSISAIALGMPAAMAAYTIDNAHTPGYGLGYICDKTQPKVCVATHYDYSEIFNNETVAQVRHHYKGAFAFGAPDLATFNIHGDGKVWWREGVAADGAQTPRPNLPTSGPILLPAPQHQVYDVINETVEANEIDPALWYPEGHRPELVREWPVSKDLVLPNPFEKKAEEDEE